MKNKKSSKEASKVEESSDNKAAKKKTFRRPGLKSVLFVSFPVLAIAIIIVFSIIDAVNPEILLGISKGWAIAIGLVSVLIFIAGLYILAMMAYLVMKRTKRFVHSKYLTEVIVVSAVVLISFAFKSVISYIGMENEYQAYLAIHEGEPERFNFVKSFVTAFFSAAYASIGGLTFEGLDQQTALPFFLLIGYYGSAITAGLVVLSAISSHAAYEPYSRLVFKCRNLNGTKIHVFTSVNEETLHIARSIDGVTKSTRKNRGEKSFVVFAGPALPPFDRHDPQCAEIMANGWTYFPFSSGEQKCLLDILNIKGCDAKVNVYAFDVDDDHIPDEEKNMDFAFLDIDNRTKRLQKLSEKELKGRKFCLVSYYILTKRSINYQAYGNKIDNLIDNCAAVVDKENAKRLLQKKNELDKAANPGERAKIEEDIRETKKALRASACSAFAVYVWNESDAIGKEVEKIIASDQGLAFTPNLKRTKTNVWTFGFGPSGQAITNSLYVMSTDFHLDGGTLRASAFQCDVFDPQSIKSIIGLYSTEIPYAAINLEGASFPTISKSITDNIASEFGKMLEDKGSKMDWAKGDVFANGTDVAKILKELIENEMPFPSYRFHNFRFGDDRFREKFLIDSVELPDYIVFSSGDDFENIRFANALLSALRQRRIEKPLTIFVNVWDEKNGSLILGFNDLSKRKEKAEHPFHQIVDVFGEGGMVKAVVVGNNNDLYHINSIESPSDAIHYNSRYESNTMKTKGANTGNSIDSIEGRKCIDFRKSLLRHSFLKFDDERLWKIDNLSSLRALMSEEPNEKELEEWRTLDLWRRRSTVLASTFAPCYGRFLDYSAALAVKDGKDMVPERLIYEFCHLEHQRWMRVHIGGGWIFGYPRNDQLKIHNSILPYLIIPKNGFVYDYANILLGIAMHMSLTNTKTVDNASAINQDERKES